MKFTLNINLILYVESECVSWDICLLETLTDMILGVAFISLFSHDDDNDKDGDKDKEEKGKDEGEGDLTSTLL